MLKLEDIIFGKITVLNNLLTEKQLNECIRFLEASPTRQRLGEVMLAQGYLTKKQYQAVLELQKKTFGDPDSENQKKLEGVILGKLAVTRGYITEQQLQESLNEQRRCAQVGVNVRLAELLVQKRYLSSSQVREILLSQKIKILYCDQCGKKYNIVGYNENKPYNCRLCSGKLSPRDEDIILTIEEDLKPAHMPFAFSPESAGIQEEDVQALLNERLTPSPENFQKFIQRTLYYYSKGNLEEALNQVNTALTLNWQDYKAHNLRALIYLRQESYADAIEECDRSLAFQQANPNAYFYRGIAYYNKYLFEKALYDFNEGIKQAPSHPALIKYRGMCYFKLGKNKEAVADLTKYLQLAPTASDVREIHGVITKAKSFISVKGKELGGTTMVLVDVPADKLLASLQMKDIELGELIGNLPQGKALQTPTIQELPAGKPGASAPLPQASKMPAARPTTPQAVSQPSSAVPSIPRVPPHSIAALKKSRYSSSDQASAIKPATITPKIQEIKPMQPTSSTEELKGVTIAPEPPQEEIAQGVTISAEEDTQEEIVEGIAIAPEAEEDTQEEIVEGIAIAPEAEEDTQEEIVEGIAIAPEAEEDREETGAAPEHRTEERPGEEDGPMNALPASEEELGEDFEEETTVLEKITVEEPDEEAPSGRQPSVIKHTSSLEVVPAHVDMDKKEDLYNLETTKVKLDSKGNEITSPSTKEDQVVQEPTKEIQQKQLCPGCKHPLEDEWLFCPFCTCSVYPQPCPRCSREIRPGWKICPICGPTFLAT